MTELDLEDLKEAGVISYYEIVEVNEDGDVTKAHLKPRKLTKDFKITLHLALLMEEILEAWEKRTVVLH